MTLLTRAAQAYAENRQHNIQSARRQLIEFLVTGNFVPRRKLLEGEGVQDLLPNPVTISGPHVVTTIDSVEFRLRLVAPRKLEVRMIPSGAAVPLWVECAELVQFGRLLALGYTVP